MPDLKYQIEISVDAKTGVVAFTQIGQAAKEATYQAGAGFDDLGQRSSGVLASIKANWMAATAAILAGWYTIKKTVGSLEDVTMAAARYETLGVVMRVVGNTAGYTGAQMEEFARGLEKTGISMTESRQSLTRMVQAHLDLGQATKLARIAQDAAVIGNINSSEAFQRMIYSIQSAQVEMLRTIGINVNFENSYQQVAKATGRATTSFSETEKSAIRMNVVLEAGPGIAGAYEAAMGTAGKQVLSLARHFENLKVLAGAAFTPALSEAVEVITGAVVDLNGELSGPSKTAITNWGVSFRLTLIDIEAEIMRLSMLVDKVGGTLTSAKMLLFGPGTALGNETSRKGFEAAAAANMEFERRYNETDKKLEELAKKSIALEYSQTPAGQAAMKAAEDAAEKMRMAAVKGTSGASATEERQRQREDLWKGVASGLSGLPADIKKAQESYTEEMQPFYRQMGLDMSEVMSFQSPEMAAATEKQQADLQWTLGLIPGYVKDALEKAQAAYERSFGKGMIDSTRQTAYAMQSTFSDVFFDAMRGQLKDFSDYWDAFLSSLERTFADMAARMAAQELFGYDMVGGGRNWGLAGAAASGVGSLLGNWGIGGAISAGANWLTGGVSDVGSSLWEGAKKLFGFQEGTAYVPRTMPALVHAAERVVPADANRDWGAALQFLVGGQVAQTGTDAAIAAALGNIAINTGLAVEGIHGLTVSLGPSGPLVNTLASWGAGMLATLATGNLGLGIAAGKGVSWALGQFGIGQTPDIGLKAAGLYGPEFDPSTLPSGFPGQGYSGPADPWGMFNIEGSRQFGGEVNVSGLYALHAPEVVYTGAQERDRNARLDRVEKALAERPAVSPVFQLVNNGVITTPDVPTWFAGMIQQYEDQFSAASQDRIQTVTTAGVKM